MKLHASWLLFNILLFSYILILLIIFRGSWGIGCVEQLTVWLLVYDMLQALHVIRTITVILIWKKAQDPALTQIKVEVLFGLWIFLTEIVWLIYGNTFIYDTNIKECNETFHETWVNIDLNENMLRGSALALVIYGYLLFLVLTLVILFYIGAFFAYRAYCKQDQATMDRMLSAEDAEGDEMLRATATTSRS